MSEINKKMILLEQLNTILNGLKEEGESPSPNIIINYTPKTWLNQSDYAKMLGISRESVYDRIRKHLYDTPEGMTDKCYNICGKNNSPVFDVGLANKYYEINLKNTTQYSTNL